MQFNTELNEEHTADIVEAALAIKLLNGKSGFQVPTRFDHIKNFYAQLLKIMEEWVPFSVAHLGTQVKVGPPHECGVFDSFGRGWCPAQADSIGSTPGTSSWLGAPPVPHRVRRSHKRTELPRAVLGPCPGSPVL
mgnify:CR=1 FL=1